MSKKKNIKLKGDDMEKYTKKDGYYKYYNSEGKKCELLWAKAPQLPFH